MPYNKCFTILSLWSGQLLLELEAGLLDQLGPARAILAQELVHLRWGVADRLGAELDNLRLHLRAVEHLGEVAVEPGHEFGRRTLRRENTLPAAGRVAGHELADGGGIGILAEALRAGHREESQAAAPHVRCGREHAVEDEVGVAAGHVLHRLRAALARDVGPFDSHRPREL